MMTNLLNGAQVANKLFSTIARLRLLLVMFVTLSVSAEVWGDTTVDIAASDLEGMGSNQYAAGTKTVGLFTISADGCYGTTQFRITQNKTITISCSEDYAMTKIVFTTTSGYSIAASNLSEQTWSAVNGQNSVSFKHTNARGARITKIAITYSSVGQSYAITAQSNNTDYGTVSVTGTTITATPNDCYQVVSGIGGYTIKSGTATVTHEGNSNTLTVNASTDCSIQVNFEKKPVNTYIDNVQNNESVELCGTHDMPSLSDKTAKTEGTCEELHWHFMGWVTEANKENPTDENISEPSTNTTANGTTYYAVWAKGETTGSGTTTTTFNAGVDNIATGKNGIKFTMSNTTGSNGYYQVYSGSAMTISSDNPITSFIITCTESGTSKYGPGNITFKTGSYSYSGTNGTWTGNSKSIESNNSSAQLRITTIVVTTSGGTTTTYSDYTTQCSKQPSRYLTPKYRGGSGGTWLVVTEW